MPNKNKINLNDKEYNVKITRMPKDKSTKFTIGVSIFSLFFACVPLVFQYYQYDSSNNRNEKQILMSQAQAISAWIKEDEKTDDDYVALNNSSSSPVYDVVVTTVSIGNDGSYVQNGFEIRKNQEVENGVVLSILPPGKYKSKMYRISHGMSKKFGVEISFKDSKGNSWIISADGQLRQINKSPFDYYNIPSPIDFKALENQ